MPQFAANLSFLYTELPFLDRFEAAAQDGFKGVECLFPYEWPAAEVQARLQAHGLQQVLINAYPGDWAAGERGLACLPGREAQFRASVDQALEYAGTVHCPRIHVVAGLVPAGADRALFQATYVSNVRWAAERAQKQGVTIMIEPINPRDVPGVFLQRQDHAHELHALIAAPNVQVQMDLYHCQIVEGDVASKIRQHLPTGRIGHFQLAGVPERNEPDTGELNYGYLFDVIDTVSAQCGWQGWIGCEYRPARGAVPGGTSAGLGWMRR